MRTYHARVWGVSALLLAIIAFSVDPILAAEKAKPKRVIDRTKAAPVAGFLAPDAKLDAAALAKHIDAVLGKQIAAEKAEPSPRCTDEEFLRRATLDISGKIPTEDQAKAFLDDPATDKRAKLIDSLLASKEYGKHMADVWQALLLPRNSDNRRLAQFYPNLVKWLEDGFNAGTGWDKMARDLLTVTGEVDKAGPAVYWIANPTADKVTDNVSRMLLGIQLQCAQCHNHPFTDFKQDEYWGMAAFFLNVRPDGNPRAAAKNGTKISIVERAAGKGKRKGAGLPESAKVLPPKFLSGAKPSIKAGDPARPVLAKWLTAADNPFFAKAMANRVWSQFFGRGIVNPVDDMHDASPSSHPELLHDLANQFASSGFDVKHLIRSICLSDAYQRSARPVEGNRDHGPELFARQQIRPLTPEQLHDSLAQVVGANERRPAARNKAVARGPGNAREVFVNFFGAEDGADPTEYQTGIPQVLQLMNSPRFNNASSLGKIMSGAKSPADAVERLYLTVLSRRPTKSEQALMAGYLAKHKDNRREGLAGVLWALLNSSEFALNR
ncbi:MAG: DUF1549 and DUF1553 domain-containing protein [Gemmataceae bacterium]|nr:DUF1549 and DUF1553 domain-containing protein [Gemmataceae bacterium]